MSSPTTRRMTPPPIYDSRVASQSASTLKPYLTLPYRLSLTWLCLPVLSLIFVAFRLELSAAQVQASVSEAKANLLTSCSAAEQSATAAASLPRFMAAATNRQIADAVNGTMNGARAALILSLTIVEAIINFVIDIYRSTFLCFVDLIVHGGLSLLIGAVQEITNFLNSTLGSIQSSIQSDISSANSAIQSAVSAFNSINPFGDISIPQFSIPSLSLLNNVTVPTDFENTLISLNNSLPTLDSLRNAIQDLADTPFEILKADINSTFLGLQMDPSVLPIPQQNTLSFCGELDTSAVDDLGPALVKATKIGIVIIIVLVILLIAANCALEWYKDRCQRIHLQLVRQAWMSDPAVYRPATANSEPTLVMSDHNLLVLASSSAHPLLSYIAARVSAICRLTPSQFTNLQWFFHYVFHPPVFACFLIGFFGILSVQLQLIALGPVEAEFSNKVASSVTDFSNTIATQINASMYNQSASYATEINGQVATIQTTVNSGLFGWVNGTTSTLNDTLATFYSDIQNTITSVFNNTILEDPVLDFVQCIIGNKIEALEEALTFLNENLQIDIPQVNESVLVLSPQDVNEVAQPISLAAVGGGDSGSGGLVGEIVDKYAESLKQERIMFGVFLGLWGLVVLMAICIILYHSYGKTWVDSYKRRKWFKEQRSGIDEVGSEKVDNFPQKVEEGNRPRSFGPLSTRGSFFSRFRSSYGGDYDVSAHPQTADPRPTIQRSWDSFLDASAHHSQRDDSGAVSQNPITEMPVPERKGPRKLLAIGQKALGRERFVTDEERAKMEAAEAAGETDDERQGWLTRFTSVFIKERYSDSESDSSSVKQMRQKPQLSIAIDTPISRRFATNANAENSLEPAPTSAWSVSPGPPQTLPWLSHPSQTASRKPALLPPFPLRPKPKKNVNAQRSVDFTVQQHPTQALSQSSIPPSPISVYPSSVVQMYQANDGRYPALLSHPSNHQRTSSVPFYTHGAHAQSNDFPVPRNLMQTQVTSSTPAVDPFKTPFDDDARVLPSAGYRSRYSVQTPKTPTNPFVAVAF